MNNHLSYVATKERRREYFICTNKSPIFYTIPTQSHLFVYTSYIYNLIWFEKDTLNTLNSCSAKESSKQEKHRKRKKTS